MTVYAYNLNNKDEHDNIKIATDYRFDNRVEINGYAETLSCSQLWKIWVQQIHILIMGVEIFKLCQKYFAMIQSYFPKNWRGERFLYFYISGSDSWFSEKRINIAE